MPPSFNAGPTVALNPALVVTGKVAEFAIQSGKVALRRGHRMNGDDVALGAWINS
jgi:hypothetical protein